MLAELADRLLAFHTPPLEMAFRLTLAIFFGLVVGWEREAKDKPAGLRTHMLVSLGSASFMLATLDLAAGPLRFSDDTSIDPSRIVQGVITGIGFLGAGCIIRGDADVRGLTTGASVWVVGAVGVACGGGLYVVAAMIACFTLIVLSIHRLSDVANSKSD